MIRRSMRPSKVNEFIELNSPEDIVGTPGDNWRSYLQRNGGTGQTFHDLESSWAQAQGATGGTLRDKISSLVTTAGYTVGYLWDRVRAFLSGEFGAAAYVQEDGASKYMLEDGSGFYILEG